MRFTFQDGKIIIFDIAVVFDDYPQYKALLDRKLFLSAQLEAYHIVVWNDDLDLFSETIYKYGIVVDHADPAPNPEIGNALIFARALRNISQTKLSKMTGITQSDISRLERGLSNPTISTMKRLAAAMDMGLEIKFIAAKSDLEEEESDLITSGHDTIQYLVADLFSEDPYAL